MRSLYIVIVLSLTLLLTGCGERDTIKPSGKVIKIGVIGPLSGESASIGRKALEGLQAAQAIHPLTANGDRIELIVKDDESSPEKVADVFLGLLAEEKLDALITLSTSDGVMNMTKVINAQKLPVIVALASHESITTGSPYISRVCMNNAQQSRVAAYFIHDELFLEKTAIFYNAETAYSNSLAHSFQEAYEKIGGEIIADMTSGLSIKDLRPILRRLKTQGVEVLYTSVKGKRSVDLLRLRQELDWDVVIIGSDGMLGSLKEYGLKGTRSVEGLFVTENYADDSVATIEEVLLERYAKKNDVLLNTHSYLAYESYLLLLEALAKCSAGCKSDELNSRLRDHEVFRGLNDRISVIGGEVQRPIFINHVHNAKMLMHLKVY